MSHFLDTNILLYSISSAPKERGKRDRAIELLDDDAGVLSVQVLQEFYVQATRPSRSGAVTHQQAETLIEAWLRFRIEDLTVAVLKKALSIRQALGFSYWDSAVVASALAAGCDTLYSEDLSNGQVIEGVTIVNPFRP
ncbi:MAG: PIN domain-containing protein [Acidobacteria bacterium]|nr:PIN domain-containing protein [Acidobacteriota bacterium]